MITLYDVLFWTPFGILGYATILFVILNWRYWFGHDERRHPAE
jgi:hypothetical protein